MSCFYVLTCITRHPKLHYLAAKIEKKSQETMEEGSRRQMKKNCI